MNDKLTPEQLRNRFAEIGASIDSGRYKNELPVLKRRVALLVLGEYLPQYNTLSEEEKQSFGLDVDGLVKKVKENMVKKEEYEIKEQLPPTGKIRVMEGQKKFRTIEDYLTELNSEAFRAGVHTSLRHTQETGYVTGFFVYYDSAFGIYFSDDIHVGGKSTLGGLVREKELSKKLFGKRFGLKGLGGELDISEMIKICDEMKKRKIVFPKSGGVKTREDRFEYYLEYTEKSGTHLSEMTDDMINDDIIIDFHTYPSFNFTTFKPEDIGYIDGALKALNRQRKTSKYNPISVTLEVGNKNKRKRKFPVSVIQERTSQPIDEDNKFFYECSREIYRFLNNSERHRGITLVVSRRPLLFGQVFYSMLTGHYTKGKGFSWGEEIPVIEKKIQQWMEDPIYS